MIYPYLKLAHIASLVMWLGPAVGAYWIVVRLGSALGEAERLRLEKSFEEVLRFEHAMFLFLLGSGIGMFFVGGWSLSEPWLQAKLVLVCEIAVIEIFDIWISHVAFRRSLRGADGKNSLGGFFELRRKFYRVAIPVLVVSIPAVMFLATVKP